MRSPVRVFIVEDSPLIRKRIIDNLHALGGFDVVGFAEAESPAVALDVFRHAPGSKGAQDYEALGDELLRSGFVT